MLLVMRVFDKETLLMRERVGDGASSRRLHQNEEEWKSLDKETPLYHRQSSLQHTIACSLLDPREHVSWLAISRKQHKKFPFETVCRGGPITALRFPPPFPMRQPGREQV
jgi:hypothetical protein